jgi:hypothetical protein
MELTSPVEAITALPIPKAAASTPRFKNSFEKLLKACPWMRFETINNMNKPFFNCIYILGNNDAMI